MAVHGIREVPVGLPPAHADFLNQLRDAVVKLQGTKNPPGAVTNLSATALPGGAHIQFTQSGADGYTVYRSETPNAAGAMAIDIGASNFFQDNHGIPGATYYYWVRPRNTGAQQVPAQGPVSAKALTFASVAAAPPIIPVSQSPATLLSSGKRVGTAPTQGQAKPL